MAQQRKLQDHEIPSFSSMVSNAMTAYALSTRLPKVYATGYSWYEMARNETLAMRDEIANVYRFSDKQAIDTVAILSPGIAWGINVDNARSILLAQAQFSHESDRITFAMDNGVSTPYGWQNHRKAWQVLDSKMTFDPKPTSLKTWNFGQCIEKPDSSLAVCVDQHIAHILIDDGLLGSMSIKPRQYRLLASVITHCAELLGILPSRFQAIIWQHRQYTLGYVVD